MCSIIGAALLPGAARDDDLIALPEVGVMAISA